MPSNRLENKPQARIVELESQLESLTSKLYWADQKIAELEGQIRQLKMPPPEKPFALVEWVFLRVKNWIDKQYDVALGSKEHSKAKKQAIEDAIRDIERAVEAEQKRWEKPSREPKWFQALPEDLKALLTYIEKNTLPRKICEELERTRRWHSNLVGVEILCGDGPIKRRKVLDVLKDRQVKDEGDRTEWPIYMPYVYFQPNYEHMQSKLHLSKSPLWKRLSRLCSVISDMKKMPKVDLDADTDEAGLIVYRVGYCVSYGKGDYRRVFFWKSRHEKPLIEAWQKAW